MVAISIDMWKALIITTVAGLTTAIGGSVAFFSSIKCLSSHTFLSSALGFSAGVIIYLALSNLYNEAIENFTKSGYDDHQVIIFTMLSILGGILVSFLLDHLVHTMEHRKEHLKKKRVMDIELSEKKQTDCKRCVETDENNNKIIELDVHMHHVGEEYKNEGVDALEENDVAALKSIGVITTLSIVIHNIPEGIIAYIGFLSDPVVGIMLAVGIAAHNIPLGISIAVPYKTATKSAWKAFLLTVLAGMAEPISAFICMIIFSNSISNLVAAILFGFAGGAMLYVSVFELIPTAMHIQKHSSASIAIIVGIFFIMFIGLFHHHEE